MLLIDYTSSHKRAKTLGQLNILLEKYFQFKSVRKFYHLKNGLRIGRKIKRAFLMNY